MNFLIDSIPYARETIGKLHTLKTDHAFSAEANCSFGVSTRRRGCGRHYRSQTMTRPPYQNFVFLEVAKQEMNQHAHPRLFETRMNHTF